MRQILKPSGILAVVCLLTFLSPLIRAARTEQRSGSACVVNLDDRDHITMLLKLLTDAINRPNAYNLEMLSDATDGDQGGSLESAIAAISDKTGSGTALDESAPGTRMSARLDGLEPDGEQMAATATVFLSSGSGSAAIPVKVEVKKRGPAFFITNVDSILTEVKLLADATKGLAAKAAGADKGQRQAMGLGVENLQSDHMVSPKSFWNSGPVFNAVESASLNDGEVIFSRPYDLAPVVIDQEGEGLDRDELFVTDANWDRIIASDEPNDMKAGFLVTRGSHGTDTLGFCNPTGIANMGVYWLVADEYNDRAQVYIYQDDLRHHCTIEGGFDKVIDVAAALLTPVWDDPSFDGIEFAVLDWGNSVAKTYRPGDCARTGTWFSTGSGVNQLYHPTSLCYARSRTTHYPMHWVYVADAGNRRVVLKQLEYPFHFLSTPPGMFEENAYLTSVTVDYFGYPYVVDNQNCKIYLLEPDLSGVIAVFGSEGTGSNQLLYPTSFEVTQGWDVPGDARPIPKAVGDAFATEFFGPETGVRRYQLRGDVQWGDLEYQPKPFDNEYCRDYLRLWWYQTGVCICDWNVYALDQSGVWQLCAQEDSVLSMPGDNYVAYELPDSTFGQLQTYKFEASIRSVYAKPILFFPTPIIDSFSKGMTIDRSVDDVCSIPLNFRCNDTSATNTALQAMSCSLIYDPEHNQSYSTCVYYEAGKWWGLIAPELQDYDTSTCNVTYHWTGNTFYEDTLVSVGTEHLITKQDTVWVHLSQPEYPYPTVTVAEVGVASCHDSLIGEGCPYSDSAEVRFKVYPNYCATPCVDCSDDGCPMLYGWNGESWELMNNILPQSEGSDSSLVAQTDVYPMFFTPYSSDSTYRFLIREDEREISYLNRTELYALDYQSQPGRPRLTNQQGIVSVSPDSLQPVAAVLSTGESVIDRLRAEDGYTYTAEDPGFVDMTYSVPAPPAAKVATAPDEGVGIAVPPPGKDGGLTKVAVGAEASALANIYRVYALNENGEYVLIDRLFPRKRPMRRLTELDEYIVNGQLRVRIEWTNRVDFDYLPFVRFQRLRPTFSKVPLVSAVHSADGDVRRKLDRFTLEPVVLHPGQEIELHFLAQPVPDTLDRVFFMIVRGRYETLASGAAVADAPLPDGYEFEQNYPNPFNPVTTFRFSLPQAENVKLEIYNILGKKVSTVVAAHLPAGNHIYEWDGRSADGQTVASGVYFARLTAGRFISTKKMVVVK